MIYLGDGKIYTERHWESDTTTVPSTCVTSFWHKVRQVASAWRSLSHMHTYQVQRSMENQVSRISTLIGKTLFSYFLSLAQTSKEGILQT